VPHELNVSPIPINMNIEKRLGKLLRPLGFSRYDTSWRRNNDIAFDIFEISYAPMASGITFNYGVYFKNISQDTNPVESKCHIRSQLRGNLQGLNFSDISEEFDDSDELSEKIIHVIDVVTIPWFDLVKTKDGIAKETRLDPTMTSDILLDAIKYESLKLD
jgi:hypothetical protein